MQKKMQAALINNKNDTVKIRIINDIYHGNKRITYPQDHRETLIQMQLPCG